MSSSAAATTQDTPVVDSQAQQPSPVTPLVDQKPAEPAKTASEQIYDKPAEPTKTVENKTETKDASEAKPSVPEKYDLKLPEKTLLKPESLEKIASLAKERGFTNEQAQQLVTLQAELADKVATDAVQSFLSTQTENLKKLTTETWVNDIKNDKEFGGDKFNESAELARRVIDKYGDAGLKADLEKTGYGNYPGLIRLFARLGKAMSSDKLMVVPSNQQPGKTKSAADILYGAGASNKE